MIYSACLLRSNADTPWVESSTRPAGFHALRPSRWSHLNLSLVLLLDHESTAALSETRHHVLHPTLSVAWITFDDRFAVRHRHGRLSIGICCT